MCLGSSDRSMTQNVGWPKPPVWGDAWERPEVIPPGPQVQKPDRGIAGTRQKDSLKTKPKSQSSKTSGGTY